MLTSGDNVEGFSNENFARSCCRVRRSRFNCLYRQQARPRFRYLERPPSRHHLLDLWDRDFHRPVHGKVEYDDGGRISFVDSATKRYMTIDGDCRVMYQPKAN